MVQHLAGGFEAIEEGWYQEVLLERSVVDDLNARRMTGCAFQVGRLQGIGGVLGIKRSFDHRILGSGRVPTSVPVFPLYPSIIYLGTEKNPPVPSPRHFRPNRPPVVAMPLALIIAQRPNGYCDTRLKVNSHNVK